VFGYKPEYLNISSVQAYLDKMAKGSHLTMLMERKLKNELSVKVALFANLKGLTNMVIFSLKNKPGRSKKDEEHASFIVSWIGELDISLHKGAHNLVEIDRARLLSDGNNLKAGSRDDTRFDVLTNYNRENGALTVLKKIFGNWWGIKMDKVKKAEIRTILKVYKKLCNQTYHETFEAISALKVT